MFILAQVESWSKMCSYEFDNSIHTQAMKICHPCLPIHG